LPTPACQLPSLRLPEIDWKRPAVAFALVAAVLLAGSFGLQATPRAATAAPVAAQAAPVKQASAAVAPAPIKEGLQQLVDNFANANPGQWGIVVKDLKTGQTASYMPDRQFTSASLYKLFVAQRIYQRVDLGQLDYSQAAGGGTGRNIDGCLTIMINISDNACGRALGSILGWGAQNQALAEEGYKTTDLSTPQQTSAADVARLYDRLYSGTLLSPSSSQRFMDLLKSQRVNNRLPQGLPAGTTIAHKTGDLDGVTHDAGIVFGPKTDYIVVVTSGPWSTPGNAVPKFADLSSQLWNFFEN
jgi:beta-lactamase class A